MLEDQKVKKKKKGVEKKSEDEEKGNKEVNKEP